MSVTAGSRVRWHELDRRQTELRLCWDAMWRSRALVLAAGWLAALLLVPAPSSDPGGLSTSFGSVGNVLMAPIVRWDAIWYVHLAQHGYASAQDTAFYPLYPWLIHAGAWVTRSAVLAGALISAGALFASLVIVHRLTSLELGEQAARSAVVLLAFTPMAVFFSALYTEALFLALSAGCFYAARRGRWAIAGLLGGLGAMTRPTGVLLLVPVTLMFLYGPRTDLPPARPAVRWRPRYRCSPAILWTALIPAGTVAYVGFLALHGFGPSTPMHAELRYWDRQLAGPVQVLRGTIYMTWYQVHGVLTGADLGSYGNQVIAGSTTLLLSVLLTVVAVRRLPAAYWTYTILGLAVAFSSETVGYPLVSFARYAATLFPLFMVAGAWAAERHLTRKLALVSSAGAILFAAEFATWHFVA